jgi:anti-anti-sigma factor
MSEKSSISVEQRPEAVIIHVLAHDLDENNIVGLRSGITDALAASPPLPFIVDMANVKFVPSLTLGALVRLVNEFRTRRQRLIFVCLQPTVRQVITITRLDRILEIMDDVGAAVRSVGIGV